MKINKYHGQKKLILGFAREGQSAYRYLRKLTDEKIGVFDCKKLSDLDKGAQTIIKEDKNLDLYLGQELRKTIHDLKQFRQWIKSAGIPNTQIPKVIQNLTSPTNIFFDKCKGVIVGITGTKGKSTTSSLIYSILKKAGKKTILVGNIGTPCLDYLDEIEKDTIVVFELSSHQLSLLKKSPAVAVLLNIYPEHLDYYTTMDEYVNAKSKITAYQGVSDYLIYNENDLRVRKIALQSKASKISFGKDPITPYQTSLLGDFNQRNIEAAAKAARIFGVLEGDISNAVLNFSALKHRLEGVGEFQGITFYNDSLATIPEATIQAIDALGDKVQTIILGGYERKLSYIKLAEKLVLCKIRNFILFPTTGQRIWQEIIKLDSNYEINHFRFDVNTMEEAVRIAYKFTSKNHICLLSCASASFNLFLDYVDRGNQFKKYVEKIGLEKQS
jgi:UDP-N-acetylmuramoylalanine--D-glutamate ligase